MADDVLQKLSSVIGRQVSSVPKKEPTLPTMSAGANAAAKPAAEPKAKDAPDLETVIGRPLPKPTFSPLVTQRFKVYGDARKNGMDHDRALQTAKTSAGVISQAPQQTLWDKTKKAVANLPTAPGSKRTMGNVFNDAGEVMHRAWSNPMGISDEQWEKDKKQMGDYLTEINQHVLGKGKVADFAAGVDRGASEFAGGQMAPGQIALLYGTFGESAMVRAASKIGIEGAVPVARTLSKLIQAQFAAQMVEGTATGIENTGKAVMDGDWGAAGEAAIGGLVSGVMAKGLVSHEQANAKVRGDLETVAREKFGVPEGHPVKASITSRFDQLNVHQQAAVIDAAVRGAPEYQDIINGVDEKTKKINERKISDFYGAAISQSWDENVAKRTIKNLQTGRQRGATMEAQAAGERAREQKIGEWLQGAREEYQKQRTEARAARAQRRQEGATERSQIGRVATGIAEKRDEVWARRNESQSTAAVADVPKRELETVTDAQGNVMYPATYWGEQNHFGAVADANGNAIYRQTERGTEWLDVNGKFTEDPSSLYVSPDPATADTIARLSAINAEAGSLADQEEATPEQKFDAEKIAAIHRGLVSGEISAKEAQAQAGIAEKVTLPGEYEAARDGRLNGPFNESNAAEYIRGLEEEARATGATEEEVSAILDEGGLLARQATESNLHHVYRPGDYVTAKNGVKWTLDGKGMLHPDDGGQPVPLMRRGLYSNDAIQLVQSGRVGYGLKTREDRRAEASRRRAAAADIAANQEQIDHEMRLAVQREGLQPALEGDPRLDAEAKAIREQRRMSRPPRAESAVDKVVRMVFKAPTDPNSVISAIANRAGVTPEEVMRLKLANDPERSTTPEAQIARLEPGDSVSDSFRKDKPWKVEEGKDGKMYLRSGNASPIFLDRLNPSDRVKQIVENGTITSEKPEFTEQDVRRAAYDKPHYVRHQENLVQQVVERKEGKAKDPEPRNAKQAQVQAVAAEHRSVAAEAVATRAVVEAVNPTTESVEHAEGKAEGAEQQIQIAEEAFAQYVEAESKADTEGDFPQRAQASIGLRGNAGTLTQNSRNFPFHYELLPLDGVVTSHQWINGKMKVNPDFPEALQPRTVSEAESKLNALRAERRVETLDGRSSGYDFREYADKTINGSMGPAIVDQGGQTVGGNTRIAILRRHLENLNAIEDAEEREAYQLGLKAAMKKLAEDSGISGYPDGDIPHVVLRMLDSPIKDSREAGELGRLFNKKVGVQITEAARGVSYAKSLDEPVLEDIGRRVEAYDGIAAAISADPQFFTDIIRNRFDVDPTEDADWFRTTELGTKVLHEKGRDQFVKALLGTVVKDTSVLNRLEGKTPYRALERALAYIVKMKALPNYDVSGKIVEALQAAAETMATDPALSHRNDKWLATYHPDQTELMGMETTTPSEPDRMVEALWRSLHSSDAAVPRVFNDRLKAFLDGQKSKGGNLFGAGTAPTPAEAFSRAFSRELTETAYMRGDKTETITQEEFDHALRNRDMSDVEREEAQNSERKGDRGQSPEQEAGGGLATSPATITSTAPEDVAKPETKKMERPPTAPAKITKVEKALVAAKAEKGYVTPDELKTFLEGHPGTNGNVPELMRTARIMAEYVFDSDQPIGVDRKDAMAWILKERLAGVEEGNLKTKRGEYSDPNIERGFGDRIMKLHKAADASSFIHEFAHIIFPMLSDDDLRNVDTIVGEGEKGEAGRAWDRKSRLEGQSYKRLSEKFAHGLEQFLRDENPTGFTGEVKAVLAKVKEVMKKVYAKFAGDPLSAYQNTEESREVFAKMFGITDFDAQDKWSKEKAKLRSEETRMKKPSETLHPVQKMAKDAGASSLQAVLSGRVEDQIGVRIDPRKPTAVMIFDDETRATEFAVDVASGKVKVDGAEIVHADDGKWGVRFNTDKKLPNSILYQDIPRPEGQIDSREFKRWFGDSKVVDEKGEPQRVYHGTDKDFEVFDESKAAESSGHPTSRLGTFFSSDPSVASLFTGGIDDTQWPPKWKQKEGAKTVPVFLSIKKPFVMSADQWRKIVTNGGADGEPEFKVNAAKYIDSQRQLLEKQGYDGVHVKGDPKYRNSMTEEFGHDNWVAFKPEQIKSAIGNSGVFDPENPSILNQGVPPTQLAADLEKAKRDLAATPETAGMIRKMRQQRVQILENQIREQYGAEPEPVEAPVAKQALQEVKNGAATDGVRKGTDGVLGNRDAKGFAGVPKPPTIGRIERLNAGAGQRGVVSTGKQAARQPTSLAEVRAVNLQPLAGVRGTSVGTVVGEAHDAKAWVDGLKKAGLPENAPAPTWALNRKTADMLKFPGQTQVTQIALSALEQGDGAVVATSTGSGKCLAKGTKVLMMDGYAVNVEDVRVGDFLMGPDSTARRVLGLAHGFDEMFKVTPTKGEPYTVNSAHILSLKMTPTGKPYPGGQAKMVNIAVPDYLATNAHFKHRAKGYRVGVSFAGKGVTLDPYILGVWLGDGTSCRPGVTTENPEIRAFWTDYIESLGGWIRKDNVKPNCAEHTAVFYERGQTPKVNKMRGHLMRLNLIENKHIPHLYKANSEKVRLEVLAGLMDTDGHLANGMYDFISKFRVLAEDVVFIARSLGFAAYVQPCKKSSQFGTEGDYYRVGICGDVSRIPVRIARKKATARKQKKNVLVTGIKVEPVGRGEYFGFETDGDHLFLLGDFTVTHNSYTSAATIKEWTARYPQARVLFITKNTGLLKTSGDIMTNSFGYEMETTVPDAPEAGVYGTTILKTISNPNLKNVKWDLVVTDESGEARNWYREENKQGKALMEITANANKALWFSATPFHSPAEYGYLNKLNLWPKNGFDKWIEGNFAHEKVDDKIVAKLDPAKQAKLRQQLIERGQLVSQAISYDGFTAHFGVVPVTDQMSRGLDRIHEGFSRARKHLADTGKKALAERSAAFEATYTKAFLERERLPQAIELGKRAESNGWKVLFFSETSSEDLFRRDTEDPGTYQQLDEAMGGQLSKIIPPFGDVYEKLQKEFGGEIGDYSGAGNSMAERERAKADFLSGKTKHLYTTYAAGGIGVSLHDADFADRGIRGGDKPRIAIFLGPPYSGVALEQAMGRTWRFGVKSDTHAVFLATDSEPDVRLMQQKVGPRMRALRASVLGERDSLASAMSSYTDDEKVQARQEALAYADSGDEMKVTASSFQVRSARRNVGINDWSLINFPTADSAKNKGMKYGEEVTGGDWSTLYQDKFKFMEAPPSAAETAAKGVIDAVAAGVETGDGLPKGVSIQDMEPADRNTVLGAVSASASEAVKDPSTRSKSAAARQSIQAQLALPGDKTKWILTFPKGKGKGVWRYTGDPEDIARSTPSDEGERQKNIKTHYYGAYFSQEVGINSIARQAGAREAGEEINRINRSYQADSDIKFADFALDAQGIMDKAKLDVDDQRVMAELWDTVKGTRTTSNPDIQRAADSLADLHERVHTAEAEADVKLKTPSGNTISWKEITKDRNYMPQRIDWDAQVEDPLTGEVHKLRDLMGETIPEANRRRIVETITRDKGYSYDQVMGYLKSYQPNTPVLGHINRARTLDFPFVKKDWKTLMGYYREAADAIAIEKNFGHDRAKLNKEIDKIPSINGRKTINQMFDGLLQPQEWEDITAQVYNAAIAYESASKLTMSASKVIFHAVHFPVGLKGRVRPVARAAMNLIMHPKEVFENASYVGTIARQLNVADVLAARDSQGLTHQIFSKTGFNSAYKLVRAWSGESARVWMEQYAMHELEKGNKDEARRLLKNVMLISDQAIDRAVETGKFAPDDLAKGQTAFANLTAWSNNPLQMPGWARMHMEKESATTAIALSRAVRLTYALQSFSLKTASFLRENIWDEVMIHKNYKPLAYAMVAAPVVGQMLQATSSGSRAFVHRGMEGLTGRKHEHDAWDKWLEDQEHTFHDPSAAKFLKYYIDSVTLGYGVDMARMVMDPLMNELSGDHKLSLKQAKYAGKDILEHMAGPAYGDLYKTIVEYPTTMLTIKAGQGDPAGKDANYKKATKNYLMDEIPVLRQVPGFSDPPKATSGGKKY